MRWVHSHSGKLQVSSTGAGRADPLVGNGIISVFGAQAESVGNECGFSTGLPGLDALAPGGKLARGAIHELLFHPAHGPPLTPALLLHQAHQTSCLFFSDPSRTLYPPALAGRGVDPGRLYVLRPSSREQELWAVAECLRCRAVTTVVARFDRLSRVEARKLQLAAEAGGGVGVVLRPTGRGSDIYAAVTRWLVEPARGDRTVQKWKLQLIHGHGGHVGHTILLEVSRETGLVRTVDRLSDRPASTTAASRTA